MNESVLTKLIVIRYALLPKQVVAFDEAQSKDLYAFNEAYSDTRKCCIDKAKEFLDEIREKLILNKTFDEKSELVASFVRSLPFVDFEVLSDLDAYNPFSDFDENDLDEYLEGKHVPINLEPDQDEASIFFSSFLEDVYGWYNELEDKSLPAILSIYLELLESLY